MTIGIWGDSITFGACDEAGLGWPGRLRQNLPADDIHLLYNFGVCGATTADVLKRFAVEFNAIAPEKVVLALGINDSKFPDGSDTNLISLEGYQQNMQQLIDSAKQSAEEIVLVGLTPVGEEFVTPRGSVFRDQEIKKYNEALQVIAEGNDLQFIDVFDAIDPTIDLADGVHPTTVGYQKMFERIRSELSL